MKNNSVNKRYIPKLRFKEFESNYNKKTINDCFIILNGISGLKAENFKHGNDKYIPYKTVFNNWFINNNELEFFEQGTKKQNEVIKNDILITSSSETLNEIGYSSIYLDNKKVYLNSFCFILRNISNEVNSQYFNWLMKNKHYRKLIVNEGQGSTRYNLQKKRFKNIVFNFPLLEEQEKISTFLSLLDKQISLLENKLKLTEQMKEYYKNLIFKSFSQQSKKQEFNKVFKKYKITTNTESLKQVTVGKTGLNIINETNYKINNHKIIENNSLIVGIGIEEINFNLNLEKICCSPIYQTYKLNDEFNNIFIYYFISKIISKNKNLITKKSTRREYEIIIKDLEKLKIPFPNNQEQLRFGNLILNLDSIIQKLNNKIKLSKKRKSFYLINLFI